MNFMESLSVSLEGLIANKMRSFLTTLGVTIGVGAVILLVSIGSGIRSDVTAQIEGLGSNLLFVLPGKIDPGTGPGGGGEAFPENKLKLSDTRLILKRSPHVTNAVPIFQNAGTAKYGNRTVSTTVLGTTPEYVPVRHFPTAKGRFFGESEINGRKKVAVLGDEVARGLFANIDPIGKRITISGQKFTVIGVMVSKGSTFGANLDNQIWMPVSTAQSMFGADFVQLIFIEADNSENIDIAAEETRKALTQRLSDNDFSVLDQGEILGTFQTLTGILTIALGGIAGISLLVGGIGIMNIMLVSVTERVREIGIRKAVGARSRDILVQFLIESTVLSLVGGILGILMGTLGSLSIEQYVPAEVTIWSVGLAFGFSVAVGVFFGVYPAYKASKLDPIVALRYE